VLSERGTAAVSLLGDLMVLVAALGWTGNIVLNKKMPREITAVSVIFWNALAAVPLFGLLTLLFEPAAAWHPTALAIASVLLPRRGGRRPGLRADRLAGAHLFAKADCKPCSCSSARCSASCSAGQLLGENDGRDAGAGRGGGGCRYPDREHRGVDRRSHAL